MVAGQALAPAQNIRPPPVRDYISFSAISTFQSCPLRYYFRYVLGLPEETVSANLVFGSAFHAAIQFHFEHLLAGDPPPSLDTLLDVFWQTWRGREATTIRLGKGEDIKSIGRLADRMLWAFQESALAHPAGTILAVEEELRGQILPTCPDLLARLDLLVDEGEALILSDFKTSRSSWTEADVAKSAPQLLLYSELAQELGNGKPLRLEFAVMTKMKSPALSIHPVETKPQDIVRTKQIVERVWQAINAKHFYPNPSPMNCPTCPFQKQCRAWPG
jgi:CRISPR/Cas system-associated exonuclease Cas4 (RecB family)